MKPLPWSFYADVLCLVLTGVGLTLGWATNSLEMVTYHAAIGFCMTWHLGEVMKKFASQHLNENWRTQNDNKCQ